MRWQCEQHSRPGDAPGRTEVRLGACRDAMCASICTITWSSSWAETGLRAEWLADTAHRGGVHRGHRAAPHCVEVRDQVALEAQDTDRTLCEDCLSRLCIDDSGELIHITARDACGSASLCRLSWQVIGYLLKTIFRPRWTEVLLRAALCCAEGLRALLPRCRGLCAGRPVCPGEIDRMHV